ncbi:hypothetical protein LXA43DRAFT_1068555 [Ganoderma leucocontextum]|nr:hypothetical protein LXA43DRAFT_1068555 [Ganoderma leucocontextum]
MCTTLSRTSTPPSKAWFQRASIDFKLLAMELPMHKLKTPMHICCRSDIPMQSSHHPYKNVIERFAIPRGSHDNVFGTGATLNDDFTVTTLLFSLASNMCEGGKPCTACVQSAKSCKDEKDLSTFLEGLGTTPDGQLVVIPVPSSKVFGACRRCKTKHSRCYGGRPCLKCSLDGRSCKPPPAQRRKVAPVVATRPATPQSSRDGVSEQSHQPSVASTLQPYPYSHRPASSDTVYVNTVAGQYRVPDAEYDSIYDILAGSYTSFSQDACLAGPSSSFEQQYIQDDTFAGPAVPGTQPYRSNGGEAYADSIIQDTYTNNCD